LRHDFFTHDGFAQKFPQDIKARIQKENNENPLLRNANRAAQAERNQEDNKKKDSGGKKKKLKAKR
jgi:hypothetical protein